VRRILTLLTLAACAACSQPEPDSGNAAMPAGNEPVEQTELIPDTIKPGKPGGLPDDREPIPEGPIDPRSAQGAGQVLRQFGGLLEQRRFAKAYRLWSDGGRASGLTEAQFATAYDKYAEIHSEVGTPGDAEGAAGSIYVDIPFRLYGKLNSGEAFNQAGSVTLRRVNDVPGSTEDQRRWHIYKSDLAPGP
jgi:hypothetical protein